MSPLGIIFIKITGTVDERNEKILEVSLFIIHFFLKMWKTVKDNRNGFVCLVEPVKNHFMAQSQPNFSG